jgi:hypothetical protein
LKNFSIVLRIGLSTGNKGLSEHGATLLRGPGLGENGMTIGLSFEEYVELKLMPRAGADPVFFQAAEQKRDAMFPMPLVS